ncbi:hypothetical protein Hanom_Chr11g00986611 [Helianthus anomalus]
MNSKALIAPFLLQLLNLLFQNQFLILNLQKTESNKINNCVITHPKILKEFNHWLT